MNTSELQEARDNIRAASLALRAYMRFSDEIGAIALALAERGDPVALLLLGAMRDLQAQTGEFVMSEENDG